MDRAEHAERQNWHFEKREDVLERLILVLAGGKNTAHFELTEGKCTVEVTQLGYNIWFVPNENRKLLTTAYTFTLYKDGTVESLATLQAVRDQTQKELAEVAQNLILKSDKFVCCQEGTLDTLLEIITKEKDLTLNDRLQKLRLIHRCVPTQNSSLTFATEDPYAGEYKIVHDGTYYGVLYKPTEPRRRCLAFSLDSKGEFCFYGEDAQDGSEQIKRVPNAIDRALISAVYECVLLQLQYMEMLEEDPSPFQPGA